MYKMDFHNKVKPFKPRTNYFILIVKIITIEVLSKVLENQDTTVQGVEKTVGIKKKKKDKLTFYRL